MNHYNRDGQFEYIMSAHSRIVDQLFGIRKKETA